MLRFVKRVFTETTAWTGHIIASSIILAILIFIVVNFYILSSIINIDEFFYAFLLLSLLTDGLFAFIHFPRRRHHTAERKRTWFTPRTLSIVIASRNGENVIADTVNGAAKHVPKTRIIVVDDASTDRTAEIARGLGVQVITNNERLHKVGSLHAGLEQVKTPYVLILDDDTQIGDTIIPTSLLDEGYTAVSFNVMPVPTGTLINELQQFEYRNSMQIGKHMRARAGAIGNVSGAIGLYRTDDLKRQMRLHSGQFAGEDEQRTLLAHIYGSGKGVTYTDSLVFTKAPPTYRALFKQRAFSWSLASPELFVLYWRVLLWPKYHFLLKAEKAYLIYIYVTDPLRILFFWTLVLRPSHIIVTYLFYLALNLLIWLRLGCKDSLRAILFSPLYTLGLAVCRFIGYFYWINEKTSYLARRLHRAVEGRKLLAEYALVAAVIVGSCTISTLHFMDDLHALGNIKGSGLTDNYSNANFDYTSAPTDPSATALATLTTPPGPDDLTVLVEQGDNPRAVAHKAVDEVLEQTPGLTFDDTQRWYVDMWLAKRLPPLSLYEPNKIMMLPINLVQQAINTGRSLPSSGGAA